MCSETIQESVNRCDIIRFDGGGGAVDGAPRLRAPLWLSLGGRIPVRVALIYLYCYVG